MTRAVFDTNIFISGSFWRGPARQLLDFARHGDVEVVTSQSMLDELRSVLTRSGKSFEMSPQAATTVLNQWLSYVTVVTPTRIIEACRDPKDNMVLATAVAGQVEYIVTGDPDLLVLGEFEGIRIVNAKQFLEVLDAPSSLA